MATTTPNYGWPVPTSTDFVKDGATAIEALGDAIDSTVFGLPSGALTLISTTTIGSAVSSVTVSGAFSATYDNYKIMIIGGASSATPNLRLTLDSFTANYTQVRIFVNNGTSATTFSGQTAQSSWGFAGTATSETIFMNADIYGPFLAQRTLINAHNIFPTTGSNGWYGGHLSESSSCTDFTITASSGTLTGGEIRVYGYQN